MVMAGVSCKQQALKSDELPQAGTQLRISRRVEDELDEANSCHGGVERGVRSGLNAKQGLKLQVETNLGAIALVDALVIGRAGIRASGEPAVYRDGVWLVGAARRRAFLTMSEGCRQA